MTEYIEAWQCIGCGKVEAPQPCIGVCRDRRIELIARGDYEQALGELKEVRLQLLAARNLLLLLALSVPRTGQWEHSYHVLQGKARRLLTQMQPVLEGKYIDST